MIMKTAENRVGNDSKILSLLGQKLTAISQNKAAAAAMECNIRLGLIGQIVTDLSYAITHQNISVYNIRYCKTSSCLDLDFLIMPFLMVE